jgi:hypothetical protein
LANRGCPFTNPQVDFQLALAAYLLLKCRSSVAQEFEQGILLYSGISFGLSVASHISSGTERIVAVLIAVSGVNIMGLVRVQAVRDWKGDLRRSEYRILAFIIYHVL